MNNNVKVLGIAEYHPSNKVSNEQYIEHFDELGIDVRNLYDNVAVRKYRYEIHNKPRYFYESPEDKKIKYEDETSLTMQIEAAKRVLDKCNLKGKDMDGIIVATQVPEYLVPTSSILVHEAVKGKKNCYCYDINANCIAMLAALRQAYVWLDTEKRMKRILVVGGDFSSYNAHSRDSGLHGTFGDAAAAIILERVEEKRTKVNSEVKSGLISWDYLVNSKNAQVTKFPRKGMYRTIIGDENGLCYSGPTDLNIPIVIDKLNAMIKDAHITTNDISGFCFSQSALSMIKEVAGGINAPLEKCCYVGDEYGYTGVTSPILSLNRMVERGKVKTGDYVMLWTVGSGTQHTMLLIRY